MRANEFIVEGPSKKATKEKLPVSASSALPGAERWDQLDNSSPYHAYRFGVALAGNPDHPMNLEGPTGQKTVTIAYSQGDADIINATAKNLGFSSNQLTPGGSIEPADTDKVSPMRAFQGYKRR
jgi:hypothetical protein